MTLILIQPITPAATGKVGAVSGPGSASASDTALFQDALAAFQNLTAGDKQSAKANSQDHGAATSTLPATAADAATTAITASATTATIAGQLKPVVTPSVTELAAGLPKPVVTPSVTELAAGKPLTATVGLDKAATKGDDRKTTTTPPEGTTAAILAGLLNVTATGTASAPTEVIGLLGAAPQTAPVTSAAHTPALAIASQSALNIAPGAAKEPSSSAASVSPITSGLIAEVIPSPARHRTSTAPSADTAPTPNRRTAAVLTLPPETRTAIAESTPQPLADTTVALPTAQTQPEAPATSSAKTAVIAAAGLAAQPAPRKTERPLQPAAASAPARVEALASQFAPIAIDQPTSTSGIRVVQAPAAAIPLPQQISVPVHQFVTEPNGNHTLIINLAPDHLGPVTVKAVFEAGQARIELIAPNNASKETIRSFIGDIRRDLSDSGLSAVVNVSSSNGANNSTSQNTSHSNPSQGNSAGGNSNGGGSQNNSQGANQSDSQGSNQRESAQKYIPIHLTSTPSDSMLDLEV